MSEKLEIEKLEIGKRTLAYLYLSLGGSLLLSGFVALSANGLTLPSGWFSMAVVVLVCIAFVAIPWLAVATAFTTKNSEKDWCSLARKARFGVTFATGFSLSLILFLVGNFSQTFTIHPIAVVSPVLLYTTVGMVLYVDRCGAYKHDISVQSQGALRAMHRELMLWVSLTLAAYIALFVTGGVGFLSLLSAKGQNSLPGAFGFGTLALGVAVLLIRELLFPLMHTMRARRYKMTDMRVPALPNPFPDTGPNAPMPKSEESQQPGKAPGKTN